MQPLRSPVVWVAIAACLALAALYLRPADTPQNAQAPAPGAALATVTLPASFSANAAIGKRAYDANCAACHGANAVGLQGKAPPLVHKIYEPSHHADESFQIAVARGVKSHHWPFGNMPAVPGLTRGDVSAILAYVRELQAANGIN